MDYFGELLLLSIDTMILGICFKFYIKTCSDVKAVKNIELLEIDPELENLVRSASHRSPPFVGIRGTVEAIGSTLRSVNSPITSGVIQRLSVKEHVVTRSAAGFWADQERTIQEVYNCVPFVLKNRNTRIEVLDPLSADVLDLETIADRFEPSYSSVFDHIWGFVAGVRQRGLQTTEEILREGILITGIGELAVTDPGGPVRLQPPSDGSPYCITMLPIPSLVRRIEQQKRTYGYLTLIFASLGALIAGVAISRWWCERNRRINDDENRRRLEETRRWRRQRVRDKDLPVSLLCVVCRQNPREIIILPCGHVSLCEDCSEGILEACPVCRAPIEKRSAAYF